MTTRDWRKLYHEALGESGAEAADNRQLVLRHPELAARLTRQPLDFKQPEQWNGYIPPYMICGPGMPGRYIRNDSPQRVHLVAIVRQAYALAYGEPAARAWLAEINADHWTSMPPSSYDRALSGAWTPHTAIEGN